MLRSLLPIMQGLTRMIASVGIAATLRLALGLECLR